MLFSIRAVVEINNCNETNSLRKGLYQLLQKKNRIRTHDALETKNAAMIAAFFVQFLFPTQ
jgi:hypothetical protein